MSRNCSSECQNVFHPTFPKVQRIFRTNQRNLRESLKNYAKSTKIVYENLMKFHEIKIKNFMTNHRKFLGVQNGQKIVCDTLRNYVQFRKKGT